MDGGSLIANIDKLTLLYNLLGVSIIPTASVPYMYPIMKVHKCLQHDSTAIHECNYECRFIQSAVGGYCEWLSTLAAAVLRTTFKYIHIHREQLELEFYDKHGYKLRFRYGVDAWQTVALSLPAEVPANYTIHIADIVDAFPQVPLKGLDNIYDLITQHVHEAFESSGKNYIAVPLDTHDIIVGRAKMVDRPTYAKVKYGPVVRHLVIDQTTTVAILHHVVRLDSVGSPQLMVKPVKGIPIGGASSSYLLEVAADRWEYNAACRIRDLAVSSTPQAKQLARRLAASMRWYYRYADDIIALAEPSFHELMWDHAKPAEHRRSPLWIYPLRDSKGEQQLSLKLDKPIVSNGCMTASYLCLTLTLHTPRDNR